MSEAYDRIMSMLQKEAVKYRVVEHEPVLGMEALNDNLPFPREMIVKTLVFRIKNAGWVFVSTKGESKIDFGKLAKELHIARNALERPGIAEIESELGLKPGGIGPFPINHETTIVLDAKIIDLEVIYCGVGRNDRSLAIEPAELLKVGSPKIFDITREA